MSVGVEQETEEKTDQALDSIFEKDSGNSERKESPIPQTNDSGENAEGSTENSRSGQTTDDSDMANSESGGNSKAGRTIVRASDFEPGAVPILEDDFTKDGQGDFPARWDTNGGGKSYS